MRCLSAFVALFLFWLAMSGYFTPLLITLGALSALAVVGLTRRMDVIDAEGHPVQLGWRVVFYWFWLFKEIMLSAWTVSRIILSPRLDISPTMVQFRPSQKTSVGLVIHANSITLTPGTVTVEASPDEFIVHALTQAGAQEVIKGDMDRRVSACEGRG